MLVLERKIGESILIGEDIEIKVVGIPRKNRVRLGMTAPKCMPIDRKEIKNKPQ